MNKSVSEYPRILVSEVSNKDQSVTTVKKFVAKEETSDIEMGHAFLCMPKKESGKDGHGLLIFGEISVEAHDSTMVETAFVQKAREELHGQKLFMQYKGEIPEEFGPYERHDAEICILVPSPVAI